VEYAGKGRPAARLIRNENAAIRRLPAGDGKDVLAQAFLLVWRRGRHRGQVADYSAFAALA
jgi:hypothetical protein